MIVLRLVQYITAEEAVGVKIKDHDIFPWLFDKVHREKRACDYDRFQVIPFFGYSMDIESGHIQREADTVPPSVHRKIKFML